MKFAVDFRKILGSAHVGINRAIQFSSKIVGSSEMTNFDDEMISLLSNANKTYKLCKRLKTSISDWLLPDPADRVYRRISEQIETASTWNGSPSQQLSIEMAKTTQNATEYLLSYALSQYSSALSEINQFEKILSSEINSGLLLICNNFLDVSWADIQHEKNQLEYLRLDYDSFRRKLAVETDTTKLKNHEKNAQSAKSSYESQLYRTRLILQQVKTVHQEIIAGLRRTAVAQLRCSTLCFHTIQRLIASFGESFLNT